MKTCDCCNNARENPAYNLHCPSCPWCGARLIQALRGLRGIRPRDELKARYAKVVKDWEGYGHPESLLRELSVGPMALRPTGLDGPGESEPPKGRKRR